MTKEEIFERVSSVLTQSFGLKPEIVTPTANLIEDLDLDSIDAIDMVVGLEEETGLDISEDELKSVRVVQDVVDLLYRHLAAG